MRPRRSPPIDDASRLLWVVFWTSAAVLAFELILMRLLLVASWHHFAFLVISIVLLGFGVSGTMLTLARGFVLRHRNGVIFGLIAATIVATPLLYEAAQHVPVEARLAPSLLWRQLGAWLWFWTLLTLPVLLGAAAIGATLMSGPQRIARIYGGNLLGSAAGAAAAPLLMTVVPPAWLPHAAAAIALPAAAALPVRPRLAKWMIVLGAAATPCIVAAVHRPHVRVDPYKYSAALDRLTEQGAAQRIERLVGPRGLIEVHAGDTLHDLPFLGVGATPPPMSVITVDGHWAGSVLDIDTAQAAAAMDQTLMSFGYAVAPPRPRVALLGEIGATNAWLALRHDATLVHVVQPFAQIATLWHGPLSQRGGAVFDAAAVEPIVADPRHFIQHAHQQYDIVHLVGLEGTAAGSGGVAGLAENHLMTVEGVVAALDRLSSDGVLLVCRGIQTPPRDNVKILLTFVEALRRRGAADPLAHLVVVRDYLAVCTLVRPTPWNEASIQSVRRQCRQRQLTPVWFSGVRDEELNRPDMLEGPPGAAGDWYHHVITRVGEPGGAARIIDTWRFDVRPPTDDRPFFGDFGRLRAIGALREAFGELWLTRTELALLFVLVAAGAVAVIGVLLTLAPLLLVRPLRRGALGRRGGVIAAYFAAIGLAYLLLEMVCLSRLTHLIGDPVLAAAIVITGFLCCSGVGSLTAQRLIDRNPTGGRVTLGMLLVAAVATLLLLRGVPAAAGGLDPSARAAVALIVVAPLAFLMGFPMPFGLARLARSVEPAIPWAWGVNGFASVLAAPVATLIGMTWGYSIAGLAAVALYGVASLLLRRLSKDAETSATVPVK